MSLRTRRSFILNWILNWPYFGFLGLGALRINHGTFVPRFSDSSWSNCVGQTQFSFKHKIFGKYPFFRFLTEKTERTESVFILKRKRISNTVWIPKNTVFWNFVMIKVLINFNLFRKNKKKSFPFSFLNGFERNSTMPASIRIHL